MIDINEKNGAVTFKVRVQPRAAKTAIVGEYAGAVKLRVAAPPVDGKANDECRKFFARLFQVPLPQVEIVSGDASRDKLIRIHHLKGERARLVLQALTGSDSMA
ncbi:MAG: YggU family protein [Acidobacteria bacterium]|nr:YggU family protein [Acidobacteriota bacterium]